MKQKEKERLNLSNLQAELDEFERERLYICGIHQATIDIVQSIYEDLNDQMQFSKLLNTYEEIVGNYIYQVNNLFEICDENLEDYEVLKDLLKLIREYEQI